MTVMLAVFLTIVGAAMGSFVGALVWRLHTRRNFVSDRSECEHCHHKLAVADLIPIVSWLALRGKCRYCRANIGWTTFLLEVSLAAAFLISYLAWPLGFSKWQAIASFVLWLGFLVALAALFVYDLRYMLLPDRLVLPLIAIGFVDAALRVSLQPLASITTYAAYVVLGVAALAGVYGLLYAVSKGKWVGYGDVKLNIFIGAVLGWQKAVLVLMLANVIGFLVVVPGLATHKLKRTSRVPFGPFLILAFGIAGLFGDSIINWYLNTFVLIH